MNVFRPSELHALLESLGVNAKKGLSQNFLIDGNIIANILKTAEVTEGDFILEIGPGPGALTEALLKKRAFVSAVELDSVFAKALLRLQTEGNHLTVIEQDFLEFPLIEHLRSTLPPNKKIKVVANLPYSIATPILAKLLPLYESIESLTVMVQKEVAERMIAKPRTEGYSNLSLFMDFYSTVSYSFTVSPSCFYPRPKVHSAVVHCRLDPPLLPGKEEDFFKLTRTAFGQRRKMLRASLKESYGSPFIEAALSKLGFSTTARPEELSLENFIKLFGMIEPLDTPSTSIAP